MDIIFNEILHLWNMTLTVVGLQSTYVQASIILVCYIAAYWIYVVGVKKRVGSRLSKIPLEHPFTRLLPRLSRLLFPLFAIIFLRICLSVTEYFGHVIWLMDAAITIAILLLVYSSIREFVSSPFMAGLFIWFGIPVMFLHLLGALPIVIQALESMAISVGNIRVTLFGLVRVLFFGALLFWLGRASNNVGKDIIRNQSNLDVSTREVFTKLFEVGLFCIIFLLLLNIMGINLTALAVFGGALGVGLGLGLQAIASNFISGIIILLDKSLTVGDYVELDDGKKGFVREFKMRHAVLETYDGKDILVPNETFISSMLVNWTHKDPKQRYRVDFSVAYSTDVRTMVELVKDAVAQHPQVISGEEVPFEERPDCEIDSFGDSGINMFVEFWIEGIDDGKNRVGGDLLLIILETLKQHNISIPFPQREVRLLNDD